MCAHDDEVSWDYYINETPGGGFTDGNDEEQSFTNGPLGGATGRQEPIWFIDTIHKNINSTDDGKETNQFITALKNPKSQPYFYNLGVQDRKSTRLNSSHG